MRPIRASLLLLLPLLATTSARADDAQCIQCCRDLGLYSCPTELRVFGEGSEVRAEGGGWRMTGLWVLDCDSGAHFDPHATAVVPLEPRNGELVLAGSPPATATCFSEWCRMPSNACVQERPGSGPSLLRCTDGQPMRASEILKPGLPPPAVYVPPTPLPNRGSVPVAATPTDTPSASPTPLPADASPTALAPAAPETVYVTRTVTLTGGQRIVTETTSTAPPGAPVAAPQPTPVAASPAEQPVPTPVPQPIAAIPEPVPYTPAAPASAPQPPARAGIIVEQAVVREVETREYPPHLPAEGPLEIQLDFSLPDAPGQRCWVSTQVAEEATRRLDLGDESRLRGDFQTAVEEYRAAVTLDRCNAIAWAALGQLALQADDKGKATYSLDIATRLRPEHYGAMTNLGLAYEAQGRVVEAREAYRRALQTRPGHPPAAAGLARVGGTP